MDKQLSFIPTYTELEARLSELVTQTLKDKEKIANLKYVLQEIIIWCDNYYPGENSVDEIRAICENTLEREGGNHDTTA